MSSNIIHYILLNDIKYYLCSPSLCSSEHKYFRVLQYRETTDTSETFSLIEFNTSNQLYINVANLTIFFYFRNILENCHLCHSCVFYFSSGFSHSSKYQKQKAELLKRSGYCLNSQLIHLRTRVMFKITEKLNIPYYQQKILPLNLEQ